MLAEHPIDVMLLSTDEFVTFRCGGDSRLVATMIR
jgi:hypothetical protein